ncbi:MAG: hypothetical protein IJ801_02475 [Lachnospiraceae bacterium]|nr:hypothetical protein [Lachnospiraceae bacterium]
MEQKRRILATAMTVLFLIFVVFAYPFVAEKAHHDCTGENCPVCMELEAVAQAVSGLKLLPVILSVWFLLGVFTPVCTEHMGSVCVKNTLITLKVELLD